MSEMPDNSPLDNPTPEQLPPMPSTLDESHARPEVTVEPREAQIGWLERRGIDLANTPRLAMGHRELNMLRNAPPTYLDYARKLYEIPQDDQENCEYALVDIESDDPGIPPKHELMIVNDADFGTIVDLSIIAKDFQQPDSDPDDPLPSSPHGALKTVDIANTLTDSREGLQTFAARLMEGRTTDPLSSHYGDIGVRAGEPAPGQKDAYVWKVSVFSESVALTIAFPYQYDSVCIVRGQRREPANGKPRMAQIDDPELVLKIEGENLRELQRVYRDLYHQPDFALTEQQRRGRDELFNRYLAHQISQEASKNRTLEQAREDDARRRQQPKLREREIPRR